MTSLRELAERCLLILLLSLAIAGRGAAQRPSERYDQTFRKYTKRYFGVGFDWRLFKAQGLTESNLNPSATSWVGAKGIMQLMPSTFLEIQTKNPDWTSIDDVEWNIAAGIAYNRRLWRLWKDSVGTEDHRYFMFGSYNAGRIPILRAQGVARQKLLDPRYWASIEVVAPEVRGWRQAETINYVRRIRENLARLDDKGRVIRPADTP
ncbi:MAG: transglycosylase SLT domain-containing protein [bacterium]